MAFKGDLKNVQLADLFQTLAQNRQEGVLTLSSHGVTHRVHFSREGVTMLDPAVAGRRRLGDILLSAGIATEKDIADALREQAKSRKFLGEVLVEKGRIKKEDLDAILELQVEEEIYELFRMEGGLFEFTEGLPATAVSAAVAAERPQARVRPLSVDHVVLEAARRLDEWGLIKKRIPSLEDVYVATIDPAKIAASDEEGHLVLGHIDGRHDVRDVADALLASPFTVAKVLTRLVEAGQARPSRPEELFAAARALLAEGAKARSLKLLHRLADAPATGALSNDIAELFRIAGDAKSAARTRLRLAQEARDDRHFDEARRQLETALREWPGSSAVLEPLVAVLRDLGDGEAELRYARELADVLADAGANEGALKAMERVLELAPDDFEARRKYSDLCLRARLKEKAIEVLEDEAARLRKDGNAVELGTVYKRILSIDGGRKDVKRALAKLRRTRADRLLRAGLLITVGCGLLTLAGIVGMRWHEKSQGLARIELARQQFQSGDPEAARSTINEVLGEASRPEVVQNAMKLLDDVDQRVADTTRLKRSEREEAFNKQLAAIQDAAAKLSFDTALADAARLLGTETEPYLTERVGARLLMIKQSFLDYVARAKQAAQGYRDPERDEDVAAAWKKMSDAFPNELIAILPNVRTVAFESAQKLKGAPRETMLELLSTDESFELLVAKMKPALDALRQRNLRLTTLQQLSIEYLEAVRAAESGNIERSRALLRKVRDEYGQGQLRSVLDKRLDRLDAAAAAIQEIEQHLQRKEYVAAHDKARAAAQEYRDLQIPSTLGIPVVIRSIPTGAHIIVDGKDSGATPLVLRLPLGTKAMVRASADHFRATEATIDPFSAAEQTIELDRVRVTDVATSAKLLAPPIWHEGRLCAAGRDGILYTVDFDGTKGRVRTFQTGSISGSLTAPVAAPKGFLAAVFEGKVFRIDASGADLAAIWSRELHDEMHSPLFVFGDTVLAVTDSGRVLGLALADGTPTFELPLNNRRVVGAPVRVGDLLVAPLAGGGLAVIDPVARKLLNVHETSADLVGALATDGRVVVGTSSTGRLLAWDAKDFALRASVDLDDLPADPAEVAWPRATVALRRGLAVVDLAAQKLTRTIDLPAPPSGPPTLLDGLLFLGGERGTIYALDDQDFAPRLRAHVGDGAPAGAPVATPLGWACFSRDGAFTILER